MGQNTTKRAHRPGRAAPERRSAPVTGRASVVPDLPAVRAPVPPGPASVPVRSRRHEAVDERAVRRLFTEHGRAVLTYATRLTGDRDAAQDVVQEAMVRAWRNLDRLSRQEGSTRGWLLTVARNIVIDQARARASRPREVAQAPTTVPVEHDHAEGVVDAMLVGDALGTLSLEHRTVLEHVYLRGLSVGETGRLLGIPPGTVKSRSYYALRTLRGRYAGHLAAVGALP